MTHSKYVIKTTTTTTTHPLNSIGIPFLETSARTSTNVEQAFLTMAAEIKNRVGPVGAAGGPSSTSADRINPSSTPIKSQSSGCC